MAFARLAPTGNAHEPRSLGRWRTSECRARDLPGRPRPALRAARLNGSCSPKRLLGRTLTSLLRRPGLLLAHTTTLPTRVRRDGRSGHFQEWITRTCGRGFL